MLQLPAERGGSPRQLVVRRSILVFDVIPAYRGPPSSARVFPCDMA